MTDSLTSSMMSSRPPISAEWRGQHGRQQRGRVTGLTVETCRDILGGDNLESDEILIFVEVQVLYAGASAVTLGRVFGFAVIAVAGFLESLEVGAGLEPGLLVLLLVGVGEGALESRQ